MASPEQRDRAMAEAVPQRSRTAHLLAMVRTGVGIALLAAITLFCAIAVIVASAVRRDGPAIQRIVRFWSRVFLAIAPISLHVEGREHIDPSLQYIFVGNHQSNFDIPVAFLAAPVSIRFLAKKEVFRIPVLAQAMTAMGIVKTDRNAGGRAHTVINEGVAEAKRRGHSLLIFPEGTRSIDGRVAEFRKGAFRLAIANQLPVVPISIEGTGAAWRPGAKVFYPGKVRVIIHPPIPTADLALTDITRLRNQAQETVTSVR